MLHLFLMHAEEKEEKRLLLAFTLSKHLSLTMIPSKERVPRLRLGYILKKGLEHSNSFYIIRSAANDAGINRSRTIVSKKLCREAVDRNKLRRRVQAALLEEIHSKPGNLDLIVIPKKAIIEASFETIKQNLALIWKNLKQSSSS